MFEIGTNLPDLDAAISKLVQGLPQAQEKGLDAAARVVLNEKSRQVGKTYARPIPLRKNGQPKWKRSGDFSKEQTVQSKPNERIIGGVGNSEKYEGRLAKLPDGADGVNRSNPATEEAVRIVEPQVEKVFEQAVRNALNL